MIAPVHVGLSHGYLWPPHPVSSHIDNLFCRALQAFVNSLSMDLASLAAEEDAEVEALLEVRVLLHRQCSCCLHAFASLTIWQPPLQWMQHDISLPAQSCYLCCCSRLNALPGPRYTQQSCSVAYHMAAWVTGTSLSLHHPCTLHGKARVAAYAVHTKKACFSCTLCCYNAVLACRVFASHKHIGDSQVFQHKCTNICRPHLPLQAHAFGLTQVVRANFLCAVICSRPRHHPAPAWR